MVDIHELDGRMSVHLLGAHRMFEIWLRNAIDHRMSEIFGERDWILESDVDWKGQALHHVTEAQKRWRRDGERPSQRRTHHDKSVATASFGFWSHMFVKQVQSDTWDRGLKRLFPDRRITHDVVFDRLNALGKIRNRAAHHDAVLPHRATQALDIYDFFLANLRPDDGSATRAEFVRRCMEPHRTEIGKCSARLEELLS